MTSVSSIKEEISNKFYLKLDEEFKQKFSKLREIIIRAYSTHAKEGYDSKHLYKETLLFEEGSNLNPDEAVMGHDDFGKKRDQLSILQEAFFFLGFELRFTKESTSMFHYRICVYCKVL